MNNAVVVSFEYASGSTPGRKRTVYFADGYDKPGVDLEDGSFKRFTRRYMNGLRHADGASIVECNKLPKAISAKSLVDGYVSEGKLAHHDTKANVVVVANKPRVKPTMKWNTRGQYVNLEVVGPTGKVLIIRHESANRNVTVLENGPSYYGDHITDPNVLLARLTEVLNG